MNQHRYTFQARVEEQISARRFLLKEIYNLDLKKPFRHHLWLDVKRKNYLRAYKNQTVIFLATIHLYQKYSGNWRFGLRDIEIVQQTKLDYNSKKRG